jgi:hypothetical protein
MPSHLTARALKVTVVLDPTELTLLELPEGHARMNLRVRLPDRPVVADIGTKSVRKAVAAAREHGAQGVAIVLQGKLVAGDAIAEAGLAAQVKTPKLEAAA